MTSPAVSAREGPATPAQPAPAAPDPLAAADGPLKPVGRWRLLAILAVLTLINIVNVMDRSLMSVLAEPIKREFHLSDTAVGILTGLAFALVYGLLALPIARIADRGLYRQVIMVCLTVWSAMTAIGGLSQSFWQLAATRIGVAAGEGSLNPASHALISRLFSPQRRGMAIGVFSLGVPFGAAAGAVLAGAVAGAHGWRVAFFAIGPIGLGLIPLLFVLPRFALAAPIKGAVAWGEAFALLAHRTYLKVWLACALASTFSFGAGAFTGGFFIRTHHMTLKEIGLTFGATALFGTGSGAFLGGVLFDLVKQRRPGFELYPSAAALVMSAAMALAAWLLPDRMPAILALTAALFCYGLTAVPAMTVAQNLAPVTRRAGASALMGISTGVIGATMGPLVVGMLSDAFAPWAGGKALAFALCALPVALLAGGGFYLWAASDLRRGTAR